MSSEINLDQLHSFFELSSELMAVLTEDGCFSEANPAWQKSLGFTPRELQDTPFFDLLHPEDLSKAQLEVQKLLQGSPKVEFISRCRGKNQEYRWVRWACRFLKAEKSFFFSGQDITDLKEAEKALEENQAKFQRLSESSTEGIALHEKGVILEANEALARMFGFERAKDMVGKNGVDFTAPEYRQLLLSNILSGYEEPYEVVGLRKDGSRFNCLVSGKTAQYQGRTVRVSTFIDITKMKKREQELFESQELFRKLTEASKDGIVVSEKGVILMANPALAQMFGYEVSEMIGHNALEYSAPGFRETILKKIMEETEAPYEVMGLRKNGTRFPIEITPRLTTYQGRRVRLAFFRDITQRKKIEEEVLRQKEFSHNLINSSIDGLMAFDRECRYTLWNPSMERLTGHSREEVLGHCAFDVFPFLKQIGQDKYFYEALGGKTVVTRDRPFRTPAGRQGFFEAVYSPVKNIRGEIVGGLGIIHETTERKRVEEALQESETNLRAVFHNTFQNIILMDREGRIKAFNPNAAAAIWEESGKDLEVGRDLAEYFHPENVEFFRKNLQQVLDGEAVQLERPLPIGEGEVHWFEVNYHPVFGASGEIEGACLTSLDIDDRKRVQEALQKSEADLRAVFNSSARGFILVGRNGKIRDFNQLAREAVKRMRDQEMEVGRPLADFVEPGYVKAFKERFKKVLQGETVHLERTVKSPSGEEEWFEFTYNPVCDPEGRVIGVCAAIGSIQGRKDAEEAIRKSESNLRAIFNSSTQGLTVVDREGVVQYFNQAAAVFTMEFMGKALQIGKPMTEGLAQAARDSFHDKLKATLKGEVVRGEGRYRFKDGSQRWFEYTYHPVLDGNGSVAGVCLTSLNIDGRKKAEEALQKSESNLRAVFNSTTQGLTVLDREGVIQYFNQVAKVFMMDTVELALEIGKPLAAYLGPEGRPFFLEKIRRVLQGEVVRGERQYPFLDGSRHWYEYTYNPVCDEKGSVIGVCLTALNIDDRKKAEEALKESEEKFRKVFENAPLGMTLVDRDFNFLHVNQAFCEMVGYRPEELVGRDFREITHPDDLTENLSYSDGVLKGNGFRMQKRYLHKEGRVVWANLSVQSFLNAQGEFLYSLGMMEDITERKHAEEALRDSEEKFRRIFEYAPLAMAMFNNYKFTKANRAFEQMLGYGEGELTGKSLFEITHPEDKIRTQRIADQMHTLETDRFQTEKRYVRKDGESLWVHLSGNLIKDARGRVLYSLVAAENITDRKKSQEALQKSEADLRAVFNSGSQVVVLIGPDGNIQNFNPSADFMARRVLGGPMQKGMPFLKTLPPGADPEIFKASFQAALEGRETGGERCIRSAEGKERWVEVKYQPVLNGSGGVQGVCFSLAFIDERKRAEEALRESQERFQRFTELTREGILIHENPTVTDVNPALAAMMGYPAEEMIGKSGFDLLAPESREEARRRMMEGAVAPYEVLALRKDGSTFPAELQGRNYQDKGRTLRVLTVRDLTWQKAAERILTESEERYRKLVELLPEAVVVHAAGKVLYVNSAGLQMFGASPEEAEGTAISDFLHPDYRQEALGRVREILQTGQPTEWNEQKFVRRDGGIFDAEIKGMPILYRGISGIMVIVRDITERKKVETALRESEKDYRRLVAEIPLAMVVMDEKGGIVSANAESARLLGFAKIGDLIGKSMLDFVLPENQDIVKERIQKVIEERVDTENRETELVSLTGQRVHVEVRGIPVTFQGRKLGLAILRDVTESKKAERALRESEQLYRHLVEEIPLAILVVGDENRIVSANVEAAKLFKANRPEDLVGKDVMDFILPENREIVGKRLEKTIEKDADAPVRETELLALNGERLQVEVSGIPFTYQGRKCALSIFRDIAESKRINQMLLRYERLAAVGKVIAAIAHEVRNPLAVVSGMSQILKAKLENRSEFSQELETILNQASRLKFFMNDILDYSRSMEIHKAPVNPRVLLEESLLLAQAQLGATQTMTRVEWKLEAGLPDFLADADRLQQVLVNLILNGYQALDGKGTLVLSGKVKDGWMILGVEDDGPGIPEADMTRLFEPFFTTKKQGSGLGLSISQKIAEAHGGRIAMKRLTPHGSYFALQLPLEKAG